ncbi:hypothetical protein [Streptomyces sp. NPDC058401]|uniref:hypothetical protein n=1 Tax=Streptomyces sp. NPDC058401 TaxID=3346480 RepID=UPI003652DF76
MSVAPDQEWQLSPESDALIYPANGKTLVKPFILTTAVANGALRAVDNYDYSLRTELKALGYDLIVVAHPPEGDLAKQADSVRTAILRTIAEQQGDAPLVVGGIGRGALTSRYALVKMERERLTHQTALYFSYDGHAPSAQEAEQLEQLGDWPTIPKLLNLITFGEAPQVHGEQFAETKIGSPLSGEVPPVSKQHGSWLLERLP